MSQEQQQKVQEGTRVPGVAQASAPVEATEKKTVYQADGEEVTLTRDLVYKYLVRGNGAVTNGEVVMFISLCKANKLNPFVGDCYLIKYGSQPASMITSKEAFMKRAEAGPGYQGFEAGVIVARGDVIEEVEGSFIPPKTTLLGGWCKVYRDGRKPVMSRVSLAEYGTGKSTWSAMPATMIRKVAIAQAFREAYPLNVGGLYTPEEMDQAQRPDEQEQPAPEALPAANVEEVPVQEQAAAPVPEAEPVVAAHNGPAKSAQTPAPEPVKMTRIEETGEILDESLFAV